MLRKKKKKDDERDYMYLQALKNKKIPLLVLDPQWHELFPEHRKTSEIKNCEKRLNELIRMQGQTANNIKEYDKAKKAIMDNIVSNMTDGSEPDSFLKVRKQEKNQKLMANLNDKISEAEETRNALKDRILEKQDMEMRNTQMYKYMHNLLGAQVVELFDRNHHVWKGNVEENKNGGA